MIDPEVQRKLSIEYFKSESSKLESKIKKKARNTGRKFTCFNSGIKTSQVYDLEVQQAKQDGLITTAKDKAFGPDWCKREILSELWMNKKQ